MSLPVCKYSATTATDLVSEQSNTYRGGKSDDSDVDFLRKPTSKRVLMSSGSIWEPSRINGDSGDGDGKLGGDRIAWRGIGEGREVRNFKGE